MPTRTSATSKRLLVTSANLLLLIFVCLWPSVGAAATVTASKECTVTCTVVEAQFTIPTNQVIQWQATYTGSATQGHSFYLSTVASNLADIALTTSGVGFGTQFLSAGTYHISIRTALMGPGFYTITYNPSSTGEPHLTTTDGNHYDFQAAGEFVFLRDNRGLEIQVRQVPIPTAFDPGPDPHDQLATCVSINSAVAARVGKHRVTYQPNLSGTPDPSGLQLRVDGELRTVGLAGLRLGGGGRIRRTTAPGGLRIDFPDKEVLFVTPAWWPTQSQWHLNLDVVPPERSVGLSGPFATRSWLPALADGSSVGPMPASLDDRFTDLYSRFSNSWRVTAATSLFDYAPGTSTDTFTINWPPRHPPCSLPNGIPAVATTEAVATEACRLVKGQTSRNNCIFDVMVTGNTGFAQTYLWGQDLNARPPSTSTPGSFAISLDAGAAIPQGTFSNVFNTGFSFNAGLEPIFSGHVSAEAKFGYHRFGTIFGGHLNLYQFSGGGKFYLVAPPVKLRPFFEGGVGAYKFGSGSTRFGGYAGGGILYEFTPHFGVQGRYNFHAVNTSGFTTKFSTVQGGVRFRF